MKIKGNLSALLLGFMLFLASCAPEEKEVIVADYSGSWMCSETTSNPAGTSNYTVKIEKVAGSSTNYTIGNFYVLGANYKASVTMSNSAITMASQTIGSGNSAFSASGSGTINSSTKFTMSYKMDDGSGVIDNCSSTFTKQ